MNDEWLLMTDIWWLMINDWWLFIEDWWQMTDDYNVFWFNKNNKPLEAWNELNLQLMSDDWLLITDADDR